MFSQCQPGSGQVVGLDVVEEMYTMARSQAKQSDTILDRMKK